MSTEVDLLSSTARRISTLTQLCQRVAAAHIDSITSLGDELSFKLVKPILERCSAEQLSRLEAASPHLTKDTPEIWKDLCQRKFPTAVDRHFSTEMEEPDSWRDQYFIFHEVEAKRLEEVSSRLRSQRLEAEAHKKEREVKLTDRVPLPKRSRTGAWGITPPRTLFLKTKNEAHKVQKAMYQARIIPPMPTGKTYRVLPNSSGPLLPPPPPNQMSRVTVNTVLHRNSSLALDLSNTSNAKPRPSSGSEATKSSVSASNLNSSLLRAATAPVPANKVLPPPGTSVLSTFVEPRPIKKKDPMSSLFVPKHRAYSQRPS